MRFVIVLIGLLATLSTPVSAQDIFADFERGTWGYSVGYSGKQDVTCHRNPHTIRFSQDHTRVEFLWSATMTDYLKNQRTSGSYTVISHDTDGIIMAMDGETRRTPGGDLVVWVLKMLPDNMYCWGRTDWPSTGCIAIHIRCPDLPSLS